MVDRVGKALVDDRRGSKTVQTLVFQTHNLHRAEKAGPYENRYLSSTKLSLAKLG
jgi:hypothetical protein